MTEEFHRTVPDRQAAISAVRTLIEYMGYDPERKDLEATPRRYVAFLDEVKCNACEDISMTTFEEVYEDLVVVRNVPLFSLCCHHILPYIGRAHVGYIPKDTLLGLSKVARIVKKLSSGLTTQEALTRAIALEVQHETERNDVAVITEAMHTCMVMRGACAIGSETKVSSMLGAFRSDPDLRREFLGML